MYVTFRICDVKDENIMSYSGNKIAGLYDLEETIGNCFQII